MKQGEGNIVNNAELLDPILADNYDNFNFVFFIQSLTKSSMAFTTTDPSRFLKCD